MSVTDNPSLMWRGHETAELARGCLERREALTIHLPADYHHALFVKLHPDAPRGTPEELDVQDGAALLSAISAIRGLEEFAGLVEPARRAGFAVTIRSPSPAITLRPAGH